MIETLRRAAWMAAERAYCPYSGFSVGASVLAESGEIFTGCNVENISYGLTICAERCAIFGAVAAGQRRLAALVIVTRSSHFTPPCGACRQVLREFATDAPVIIFDAAGRSLRRSLHELLPDPFGPDHLSA